MAMGSYGNGGTNGVPLRNVYGSAPGASLGIASTAFSPYDTATMNGQAGSMQGDGTTTDTTTQQAAARASSRSFIGQPFTWWILLAVLLIGLKFVATKLGDGEEFKSIRVSVHNVIIISLASIIGIGFFKVIFNRWKVPGLTTFINAV